jgi:hypothetical protein
LRTTSDVDRTVSAMVLLQLPTIRIGLRIRPYRVLNGARCFTIYRAYIGGWYLLPRVGTAKVPSGRAPTRTRLPFPNTRSGSGPENSPDRSPE